jgi:hypothetical protein
MEGFKSFRNVFDKNRKLFYVILIPLVASIFPLAIQNKVLLIENSTISLIR